MVVFRVLHVLLAIVWAGTVFLLVFFPPTDRQGDQSGGGPFMRELLGTRRLVDWILRIAGTPRPQATTCSSAWNRASCALGISPTTLPELLAQAADAAVPQCSGMSPDE
jgi:hypothetical protein